MKLSRSWIGLMLVCLVTANSVLAEEEEEDATTTESNPELSETNSTEVLLNGSANATDLIEVNGNSTQLGRELTNPSLGETFKMIGTTETLLLFYNSHKCIKKDNCINVSSFELRSTNTE